MYEYVPSVTTNQVFSMGFISDRRARVGRDATGGGSVSSPNSLTNSTYLFVAKVVRNTGATPDQYYLNWYELGGITPVKNQAQCGSCWAFAATAEMEAFVKIYYGVELDLSEQQVVSCNPYGAGCDGGWATAAYYIFQQRGAVQENCHPYLEADPPIAPCEEANFRKYGWITGFNHCAEVPDDIGGISHTGDHARGCTGHSLGDHVGKPFAEAG